MKRGLAGILLCVGAALLAIAASGWWMQRVVFDTDSSRAAVGRILDDEAIHTTLGSLIATATTERTGVAADQMGLKFVGDLEPLLADPVTGKVLADLVADAHAHLIGASDDEVTLSGLDLVVLLRTEAVGDLAPVVVPVVRSSTLASVDQIVGWTVIVAGGIGAICVVLGIAARPRRDDAVFALGVFAVVGSLFGFTLLYAAPRFGAPRVSEAPWSALLPAIAEQYLPVAAIVSVALAIIGVVLGLASYGMGSRKTKNWSTPVRTSRYSEQRQWSR